MSEEKIEGRMDLRKRCFKFSLEIIKITDHLPQKRSAWVITDQLIRSACSIGANLVEAKGSSSRKEFKKFFEISLKSSNETVYWLCLLRDSGLSKEEEVDSLLKEVNEITKMIGSAVIKLKGPKI